MIIITLTTDFGNSDGFVGAMKGVILSICPDARVVDISHEVPPQNLHAGARVLSRAARFYPPGTIHVAVVDPGVGTSRRPIAARLGSRFFVAPDNGLLTPFIDEAEKSSDEVTVIHLTVNDYWLPEVSRTFHGRDIFAPVAAHLACGVPLKEMGIVVSDFQRLSFPRAEKVEGGWLAHVVWVDVFGNLHTDLQCAEVKRETKPVFHLRRHEIRGLTENYADAESGELIALQDSDGYVEFALVNGSAAKRCGSLEGEEVLVKIV